MRVLAGADAPQSVGGRTMRTLIELPLTIAPEATDNYVGWVWHGR